MVRGGPAGLQVVCPPADMPKKSDMHDKMGMDPHDAKGVDTGVYLRQGRPRRHEEGRHEEGRACPATLLHRPGQCHMCLYPC